MSQMHLALNKHQNANNIKIKACTAMVSRPSEKTRSTNANPSPNIHVNDRKQVKKNYIYISLYCGCTKSSKNAKM